MKNIVIALMVLTPMLAKSQSKNDYNRVMTKLVRYINAGNIDSLNTLIAFSHKWDNSDIKLIKDTYREITSFKYMTIDKRDIDRYNNCSAYFAATSTKAWHGKKTNAFAIALSPENKLTSYRIMTQSPHSDSMLNKYYFKRAK